MTDRTAPDGLPELPVVAWLIEYGRPADPVRCVYLHNAIADYRERDPGATSQTLIRLSDARQALAVQQGEIEQWRSLYRRMKNVAAGYSNYCDDSASTRRLEKEFDQIDVDARAALEQSK